MKLVSTAENLTNPIRKLIGTEQPTGLNHLALAVNPFGLDRVEPWALLGERTGDDPNPFALRFDSAVMGGDRGVHLFGGVPGGVIPDQKQSLLAHCSELLAAPLKELGGDDAHWPSIDKPQPRLLFDPSIGCLRAYQHPVGRQSLRVGIVLDRLLLDRAPRPPRLGPRVQAGTLEAAPPSFVLEAQSPLRTREGKPDRPISSPFFLWYSGSGEVIQLFALAQRTPRRSKVARMVSPLTFSSVRP